LNGAELLISLDKAPQNYRNFDKGAANKFVIDPHSSVGTRIHKGSPASGAPF
jgi:hypothetical protein